MNELSVGSHVYGSNETQVFEVVREIGRGSFGKVFQVRECDTDKSFAMKSFAFADSYSSDVRKALFNEGKLAIDIRHPNVVGVTFFHDGDLYPALPPYTIMEYVKDGRTLKQEINERKPNHYYSNNDLIDKYRQLANGMQAINAMLVHRDIKPDNILVQDTTYKIADFGLAKIVGAGTRDSTLKGINAVKYCPPEAWSGAENTQKMDMYCMGVVFFELATLQFPYEVDLDHISQIAWQNAHLYHQPTNPSNIHPELNPILSDMILKMLRKNPDSRHQSWSEMLSELDRATSATDGVSLESEATLDISSLLEKNTLTSIAATQEALKRERTERQENELAELVKRRFDEEFLNPAKYIVTEFNSRSAAGTLNVRKRGELRFAIENSSHGTRKNLDIEVEVCPKSESIPPTRNPEFVYQPKRILAWGTIKYANKFGMNVVLVAADSDDRQGTWRTVIKQHEEPMIDSSPPIPYDRNSRPKMFARAVSGDWSHGWEFTSKDLVSLMKQIL